MNTGPETPGEAELHAYVDGHLGADRIPVVEAWLAADPEARERAAAWQRQNDLIMRFYAQKAAELAPPQLPQTRPAVAGRRQALSWMAAAASAALLAGGAAGWLARDLLLPTPEPAGRLMREVVEAHRAFVPPTEAGADPVRLAAEISRSFANPVRVPDLAPFGLRLLGGRVTLAGSGEPAIQLAYADEANRRFSLYLVRPRRPDVADTQVVELAQANALYWPYAEFRCVLLGDAPPDRLTALAQAIEAQIDTDESKG